MLIQPRIRRGSARSCLGERGIGSSREWVGGCRHRSVVRRIRGEGCSRLCLVPRRRLWHMLGWERLHGCGVRGGGGVGIGRSSAGDIVSSSRYWNRPIVHQQLLHLLRLDSTQPEQSTLLKKLLLELLQTQGRFTTNKLCHQILSIHIKAYEIQILHPSCRKWYPRKLTVIEEPMEGIYDS